MHTLDADDPRPLPRPLRIRDEDIRAVGVTGADGERIVQAVADPEDAWTADAGTSDHFLRGDLVVQVRRADNAVIGLFSARYALSVRPDEYEPALDIAEDAAGPSTRGGQGTRHPTSRRELLGRMRAGGLRHHPRGDARPRHASRPSRARAPLRLDPLGPPLHPARRRADTPRLRHRPAALRAPRRGRRRSGSPPDRKVPRLVPTSRGHPFPPRPGSADPASSSVSGILR
ncbi:hypothetical protein [Brachybacterium sp. GPGPB12]|uniref:hypothetical protein n=1 Tax=Brachybacterium sp. GPGPB12 TaxID=3023517 RepID=UPI0031345494